MEQRIEDASSLAGTCLCPLCLAAPSASSAGPERTHSEDKLAPPVLKKFHMNSEPKRGNRSCAWGSELTKQL